MLMNLKGLLAADSSPVVSLDTPETCMDRGREARPRGSARVVLPLVSGISRETTGDESVLAGLNLACVPIKKKYM